GIVFQDLAGRLVGRCHPGLAQERQLGLKHRARLAQAGVSRERVPRKGLRNEVDLLHLAGHRKSPKEGKGEVRLLLWCLPAFVRVGFGDSSRSTLLFDVRTPPRSGPVGRSSRRDGANTKERSLERRETHAA